MNEAYKKQVKLALDALPEVAKETCFAMHGGTAINLFVRNMPRLSVDIDLTYIEIAERKETLGAINAALVERGLIGKVTKAQLCETAQEQFEVFCTVPTVSMGQLYGGKLCAALDRQHPRDLFDVKLLFEAEGFTDEIKNGFIFGLVNSNRPTHDLLAPNLLDQRTAFENQFEGMSAVDFNYDDFEVTRLQLIETGRTGLDEDDKAFLLSLNRLEPDWSIYDFQDFPSVKWKLINLDKFKKNSPDIYQQHLSELEDILE